MEFKCDSEVEEERRLFILIESQWNLNKYDAETSGSTTHINRITVEFKLVISFYFGTQAVNINRITVEFKFC